MNIDGSWNVDLTTPMGVKKLLIEFKVEGSELTGSMGELGSSDRTAFTGGSVDGNKLAWPYQVTKPINMKLKCTATIEGNDISGEASMGMMGKASFSGKRA